MFGSTFDGSKVFSISAKANYRKKSLKKIHRKTNKTKSLLNSDYYIHICCTYLTHITDYFQLLIISSSVIVLNWEFILLWLFLPSFTIWFCFIFFAHWWMWVINNLSMEHQDTKLILGCWPHLWWSNHSAIGFTEYLKRRKVEKKRKFSSNLLGKSLKIGIWNTRLTWQCPKIKNNLLLIVSIL